MQEAAGDLSLKTPQRGSQLGELDRGLKSDISDQKARNPPF
jgi:hypothetical protein